MRGVFDTIQKKDITIAMDDWNAKIGKTMSSNNSIGIHGLGEINERGDRLEEFCLTNNLFVGNTLLQHHQRRLWTWMSPRDGIRNQIDYIMINRNLHYKM